MKEGYYGQIMLFAGNFAPEDWEFCDGRLLTINENAILFSIIGTTYGGNGQVNFAIPDLRGEVPKHQGKGLGLNYVICVNGQFPERP